MSKIMIKDIPLSERPRERLLKYGKESLSNEELLSIILKTGTKNYSVKELSNHILKNFKNIKEMKYITINKLTEIRGKGRNEYPIIPAVALSVALRVALI